ncbi:MAG TPA: MmcQ/YjbR family DNA-binding protein [Acidimicrobiales bacterium]
MRTNTLASFLLRFPEVTEEWPFGPDVDVYKVDGKIFAILAPDDEPPQISLKCDPLLALELRNEYSAVSAGYHLNKDHWNTVRLDDTVPDGDLKQMIAHSYECVVRGMAKKARDRIALTYKGAQK